MAVTTIVEVKEDSVVIPFQTTFSLVIVTCWCVSEQILPRHITMDLRPHTQQKISPKKVVITYNSQVILQQVV